MRILEFLEKKKVRTLSLNVLCSHSTLNPAYNEQYLIDKSWLVINSLTNSHRTQ